MKRSDGIIIVTVIAVCAVILFVPGIMSAYKSFNADHGMIMSFVKFAILATLGETIALRIRTKAWYRHGFGLLPRAFMWGCIGVVIKAAFIIFVTGVPAFLAWMGLEVSVSTVNTPGFSAVKLFTAFSISTFINLIFAPVFMTFHKITDMHIERTGGTMKGLFSAIRFAEIFPAIDWRVQWGFVFKKTIPLFWIPAHTVTFMLPPQYRVLFAALLSIVLGVFLAVASLLASEKQSAV